jgi:lipopolysaccharide transport system ATP-binding protein
MNEIAIRVENLSKRYRIGGRQERYKTLRDTVTDAALAPFQRLRRLGQPAPPQEIIWALKDVSFEVKHGEVLGIIGRNGAGKTTLLKILSRITEPTEGSAEIHGRVGSLLEVGTGFHPELTGRENIYLNGAILGMRRVEIDRKFDEIVGFAETEKFIDTPVKRYSSGMYVRLAFAVAAHLEPEILLVDEVLAVGDAAFQKKCLGKMGDVAKEGRTVLFVSHNMAAMEGLCSSCVLLHEAQIQAMGSPSQAIQYYLSKVLSSAVVTPLRERTDRTGSGKVRFTGFHIEDDNGIPACALQSGQDYFFVFDYECANGIPQRNVDVGFSISDQMGRSLFVLYSSFTGQVFESVPSEGEFRCRIHRLPLAPGQYTVFARVVVGADEADYPGMIATIHVEDGDFFRTGRSGLKGHSPFLVDGQWIATGTRQVDS